MMDAESNQSKSVEVATSSSEPTITISSDSQNADPQLSLVNGTDASASPDEIDNRQLSDIVDDLVNSAEVSISGGSDTEASRPDGISFKNGEKGHGRTSSAVKKPTTFKSVSVNKTFLGHKGSIATAPSKSGDKMAPATSLSTGASAGSLAQRPRLVAKSGSGMRDGTKASVGSNGKGAAVPDPSAVWNKNRPPPVPEPKKLTDEELKKYGIHMAKRLAPDDAAGQSNWADIDDDDEAWYPGEIQWNDGTKVTLPEPTASPIPVAAQPMVEAPAAPAIPVPKDVTPAEKPQSPVPAAASPSIKAGVLASGKGLILKGAAEKPTLVARPPAPKAPIKSPWAQLPPVEKAPPIVDAPPASQGYGRPGPGQGYRDRDGPMARGFTPPPAKEIAADDFSRSGGPHNPNRELFNSQSGRYEPVTDRRSSVRSEAYSRHPAAVLQRPSHSDGPAEPSAAFQTHRSSGQEAPYGRRRGSSNVSGGSGTYLQRLQKPHDHVLPPPEVLNARRESFTGGGDSPVSPRNYSPSGPRHHAQPWLSRTSPRAPYSVPHPGAPSQDPSLTPGPHGAPMPMPMPPTAPMAAPPVLEPVEDEFEVQKKLMHEKREAARQRRLEEEARAEEEKRKRIALKLASLGPAPESKAAKQAAAKDETATPTASQHASVPSQTQNQPQHQQLPSVEGNPPADRTSPLQTQRSDAERTEEPSMNGGRTLTGAGAGAGDNRDARMPPPSQDGSKHPPHWQGTAAAPAQSERFTSWGSGTQAPVSRNLWAAPSTSNRSLGNGTFSADLGRIPDAYPSRLGQIAAKSEPSPGPIGPPGASKYPTTHPGPIGPPKVSSEQANKPVAADDRSRWASAAISTDEQVAAEARERFADQKRDLDARGVSAEEVRPVYRDSWKPVKLDSEGRRIDTKDVVQVVHGSSWRGSAADEQKAVSSSTTQGPTPPTGPQQGRASRFFPSREGRSEDTAAAQGTSRPHSPSPPPPDMDGHPAFDGDAMHPHVALPPSRPVVRLPPSTSPRAPPPVQTAPAPVAASTVAPSPSFGWASHAPYAETVHGGGHPGPATAHPQPSQHPHAPSNWQDKINDLLHNNNAINNQHSKASPTHRPVTVDSSSRSAIEPASAQHTQATVSLPSFMLAAYAVKDGSPTSKVMADECFEERDMGSTPPIRLPTVVAEAAWHPAAPPARALPRKLLVAATTVESIEEPLPSKASVMFPGMPSAKMVLLPMSMRSWSNPGRSSRGRSSGPRHPSGPTQRGGVGGGSGAGRSSRSRDPSVSYSNDNGPGPASGAGAGSGPNTAPSGRAGRGGGGFRRAGDWSSRRASTPVQT